MILSQLAKFLAHSELIAREKLAVATAINRARLDFHPQRGSCGRRHLRSIAIGCIHDHDSPLLGLAIVADADTCPECVTSQTAWEIAQSTADKARADYNVFFVAAARALRRTTVAPRIRWRRGS